MKTGKDFCMDAWRRMCGLPPLPERPVLSIAELRRTEWSDRFEQLMRNRLVMGAFRYQTFDEKAREFNYDCAEAAQERIDAYHETGNTEYLVDAANLCLLEFEFGAHPHKHFASIDDGEHVQPRK